MIYTYTHGSTQVYLGKHEHGKTRHYTITTCVLRTTKFNKISNKSTLSVNPEIF